MITSKFFIGVVEDINDPSEKNRVRVRIYGKHTEDVTLIDTEDLPWSNVVMPCTDGSISNVGSSLGLVQGSWVIGIFVDSEKENDPLIIGSLPSESTRRLPTDGFCDPDGIHPYENGNDLPKSASTTRYKLDSSYRAKARSHITSIATANPPDIKSFPDSNLPEDYLEPKTYDLPNPKDVIRPIYPSNQVTRTAGGHTFESDDTNDYERISETHAPSGTYREVIADGTTTHFIQGKGFKVVAEDDNVYIKGNCNLTIDQDCRTLIKGNYHLEVEKDYTVKVKGAIRTKALQTVTEIAQNSATNIGLKRITLVGGDDNETIGGNLNYTCKGDTNKTVLGSSFDTIIGSLNTTIKKASKISCGQKININTTLVDCSGDVFAGAGNVSLITHNHPQPNTGADATGQGNTFSSIPNTGLGK
jgi:hypothetical protein